MTDLTKHNLNSNTISNRMIAYWIPKIERKDGLEKLGAYICSLYCGRAFMQPASDYIAEKGYTEFVEWSRTVLDTTPKF